MILTLELRFEDRIRIRAYDQPCVNAVKGGTISALALSDVQALLTTALLWLGIIIPLKLSTLFLFNCLFLFPLVWGERDWSSEYSYTFFFFYSSNITITSNWYGLFIAEMITLYSSQFCDIVPLNLFLTFGPNIFIKKYVDIL